MSGADDGTSNIAKKELRRIRIKNLITTTKDPVKNLSFDMIKKAYYKDDLDDFNRIDDVNKQYVVDVFRIFNLFQLSEDEKDAGFSGNLNLPYNKSIFHNIPWFTMTMTRPEIIINPVLDPHNKFICHVIDSIFKDENDRKSMYDEKIIKELMNPSQRLNTSKLMQDNRDIVITNSQEIPIDEISMICNGVIRKIELFGEKNVFKTDFLMTWLWDYRYYGNENDKFNDIKNEIIEKTINNEKFNSMDLDSKMARFYQIIMDSRVNPINEYKDITLKIIHSIENINRAMSVFYPSLRIHEDELIKRYTSSRSNNNESNKIEQNESLITSDTNSNYNRSIMHIPIHISSLNNGSRHSLVVFESKRFKKLKEIFKEFIGNSVENQVNSDNYEHKLIRNMIKELITYMNETGCNIGILTNLSSIIILELNVKKSKVFEINEQKVLDLNIRYKIMGYEDQLLTINWAIIYTIIRAGNILEDDLNYLNDKNQKKNKFDHLFKRTITEKLDNESVHYLANCSEKYDYVSECFSLKISEIFPDGINKTNALQRGDEFHSQVFKIPYKNVKDGLGYEIDGVSLNDELILKIYQIDLLDFNKFEDKQIFKHFQREVEGLKIIGNHNENCSDESKVINCPKIYKSFIINLTNSRTCLSEIHGYAVLMERIQGRKVYSDEFKSNSRIERELDRQLKILDSLKIYHNDIATRNLIYRKVDEKLFIIDWGLSEIV
ncbi:hypothetical protein BN7_5049 [Wickerhamomyces ciferrii]|uniref:non-specific serine/threonine protein kinase n=1 Tax=Wickerhamomyces ciferrii (strain ATCC 14091 / BCRC 22168 / CBS 111 / JCM 3599 / NBRC 0793 / NRRL Y-1031 F-60-10) TaxID=1206466 RepID=K0KTW8_WICCF|nr:uncharacterized protein BN7_5049 [Wickerhamomyces ciferrii]CCH45467.1 hypothetical protein BN7_5049 [Wickerhamomyces ciferrii]